MPNFKKNTSPAMKRSGFKMRSGNKTTFKMMGSTSPLYKPKGMTGLTKEERKAKREKLKKDIEQFGKGLEGSLKDAKHLIVDEETRAEMIEKGYETPKTRKEKYGTTSFDPAKGYGVEPEVISEPTGEGDGTGGSDDPVVTTQEAPKIDWASGPSGRKFDAGTSMTDAFKQATAAGANIGDLFSIGDVDYRYQFEGEYKPPHLKGKK